MTKWYYNLSHCHLRSYRLQMSLAIACVCVLVCVCVAEFEIPTKVCCFKVTATQTKYHTGTNVTISC